MNNLAKAEQVASSTVPHPGLRGLVKSLASPVEILKNGARNLPNAGAQSLLAGLLQEIHGCILPRKIKVMIDGGAVFHIQAGNRRLFDLQAQEGGRKGHQTFRAGDADLAVHQLIALLDGATGAKILVTRSATEPGEHDAGCTAMALAAAGSVVLFRPINPDPVPAFFTALKGDMTAWITLDQAGHCVGRGGAPTWAERLVDLSHDGLTEIEAQLVQSLTSPDQPGCVILDFNGAGDHLLTYARSRSSGFAAILPCASMPTIQAFWSAETR